MQPLGGQDVTLDEAIKRLQDRRTGADLVGQCRQAQINALPGVALALPVQRLMLAKVESSHLFSVEGASAFSLASFLLGTMS